MSSPEPDRISFTEENKLRSASAELLALKPAHLAAALLCELMGEQDELDTSGSPAALIENATDQICGMAYRTARACMLIVAAGYVPEAFALARRIMEALLLVESINDDPAGNRAREWLGGNRPTLKKLTASRGELGPIANRYSSGTHIDPQGLPMLHPEGLPLSPSRETERANGTLLNVAILIRMLGYYYASFVLDRDIGEDSDIRQRYKPLEDELDGLFARHQG